jgi:hypothetical protein
MSGSAGFINARKRAPIVLGAGRACGSGAALTGRAVAINPEAASPATWTNSRLLVFLAIITPQNFRNAVKSRKGLEAFGAL